MKEDKKKEVREIRVFGRITPSLKKKLDKFLAQKRWDTSAAIEEALTRMVA